MSQRPTYHLDVVQGAPAWDALRRGKWSSSKAAIIMGGLDTLGLDQLLKDIAWERTLGATGEERFYGKAMQRGHAVEPEARDWFAFERDVQVRECGVVEHATIPNVIWSPDGLHGRSAPGEPLHFRRGIEAKSPLHRALMEVFRTGKVPSEYRWQCRWACWVGQLDGIDFVAYHPKTGGRIIEVEVTESERDAMQARVHLLERKVAEWVDIIQNKPRSNVA